MRREKKFFSGKLAFLILSGLFLYFISSLYSNLVKLKEFKEEQKKIQMDITRLEEENISLRGLIRDLSSDASIEELAREKLGYKKQGETAFIVRESDAGTFSKSDFQISNPSKWFYYFLFDNQQYGN